MIRYLFLNTIITLCILMPSTSIAQNVIYQSGFEPGEPTFTFASGPQNTPVLSATGGGAAPTCGKFSLNGKYDGAFITNAPIALQAGKYYQLTFSYRVVTCFGIIRFYRSATGANYANISSGTLLSTYSSNQTTYTTASFIFTVPTSVTQYVGLVATMINNGCNSANFWIDDLSITEYDFPPCSYYCTTGNSTSSSSYISNVNFNGINRFSVWDGYSCSGHTTSLRKTLTYPLSVSSFNATTAQKIVAAWIDWNRDGVFADPAERVMGPTDITASVVPVTNVQNVNVSVPLSAATGYTKMRVALVTGTIAQTLPCNTVQTSDYEDYDIHILDAPVSMLYTGTSVTQVTSGVNAGDTRQEVLQVRISTSGQLAAPSVSQLVFTTLGTTNVSDISNARVFHTGSSTTFSTASQLGLTVALPPSDPATMTFNFSSPLIEGDNYFWLSYDVTANAPTGNVIDAKLVSATVGGTTYPINSSPAGNRPILASSSMTFLSAAVVQNSSPVPAGSALNDVIQIQVLTSGAISPLTATSLTFRTNGTTNTGDIQNARVYFTGNSPVFSSSTQFGATFGTPPAINTDFTITGTASLAKGINYFWLTYDIKPAAACDPAQIDALCSNIVIGGVNYTPTPSAPTGARIINCGSAFYSQCSCDMMTPANWNSARNGTGVPPANVAALATVSNSFYVQNGHNMTTTSSGSMSNLYLETGSYVTASQLINIQKLHIHPFATYEQTQSQANSAIAGTYIGRITINKEGTWKHNNAGFFPGTSTTRLLDPYSIQWFQGIGNGTFPTGTSWGTVILDVPNPPNFIFSANALSTIKGNLEIRRWGTSTNSFYFNLDNPVDVDGNLIMSNGVLKGVAGFSCITGSCLCNQVANYVNVNIDGDFSISGGQWNDFGCGAAGSSGMYMMIGGNVKITGGIFKMNTKPGSLLELLPTVPSTTWGQTGGTVNLGNTNIKPGKTVTLTGNKFGDFDASTALNIETGGKLMCSIFPVTGAGSFILNNGGHLGIGHADGITTGSPTGNIQVSGSRIYEWSGTYEYYEGVTPQATGNFNTTVSNYLYPALVTYLIINKATPTDIVNLTSTTDVSFGLRLQRGILKTSNLPGTAPWLRLQNSAVVVPNGGSQLSYVDGFVRRLGLSDFTFPTGNAGRWARIGFLAPVTTTFPPTFAEFEARYVAAPFSNITSMAFVPTPILDHVSKKEHWLLNKLSADGLSTKVRLYWEDAAWSGVLKFDSLAVGRWSGLAWENTNCYVNCPPNWTSSTAERNYNGSATGNGAGSIQSNSTSQFGQFTLAAIGSVTSNPLPVQLLSFQGECDAQEDVALTWATATETNNDYFRIERSTNGSVFEPLTDIKGSGNTNHVSEYTYRDYQAAEDINYYRLSQTDYDGTNEFLKTIAVRCGLSTRGIIDIFYDTEGSIVVETDIPDHPVLNLRMFDAIGKLVITKTFNAPKGPAKEKVNVKNVEKGIYFVHVEGSAYSSVKKIRIN